MIKVREPTTQTHYANEKGRDFVVGDVHGMYSLIMEELDNIDFDDTKDRCFCVGDLIDRGPASAHCLRLTKEPWFFSTYGNHEDLLLQAIAGKQHYMDVMWHQNGGDWARQESQESLDEFVEICRELPYFITLHHKSGKKVGICHAQAPTDDWNDICELTEKELQAAIWGRSVASGKAPRGYLIKNVDLTVHGHTPMQRIKRVSNSLFIDTGGCFDTGKLTIINLDEYLQEQL